ncbi:alpha/beta fold hydrolase [Ectothiorhodospiraceae bacterium WFHF3C12]|nr:alpha/beta fold hydrolase [Ectothiorhodospiraceae bacterium WFHF3C12]
MTGAGSRPAPTAWPGIPYHRVLATTLLLLPALVSCTTTPGERFDQTARAQGLAPTTLSGGQQEIRAYIAAGTAPNRDAALHVYLTSDGTPWVQGRFPAADPTPRNPLALRLMARDAAPRLLVHRPCYGHPELPAGCDHRLWTRARYGNEVISAIDQALDDAVERLGPRPLVLIGYSGGGTIAWLLARRRDDVQALVTVAANLDTQRWTRTRGFLPLTESLNPRELSPLPAGIIQWHLVGGRDRVVPEHVTEAGLKGALGARILRYPDFDHHCCWERAWPGILHELTQALAEADRRGPSRRPPPDAD